MKTSATNKPVISDFGEPKTGTWRNVEHGENWNMAKTGKYRIMERAENVPVMSIRLHDYSNKKHRICLNYNINCGVYWSILLYIVTEHQ